MAVHADLVGACGGQLCGIHNGVARPPLCNVFPARAMAILTPDSQLCKWRIPVLAIAPRNGLWPPAMTVNAAGGNRSIEAVVGKLIAWRKTPLPHPRVVGQRSLKQMISPLHHKAQSISTRSDRPSKYMLAAKPLT